MATYSGAMQYLSRIWLHNEFGRTEAVSRGPRRRDSLFLSPSRGPGLSTENSIRRPPAATAGRCGHPVHHLYSAVPNNNLVVVFGHRSIFYCDFSFGPMEGGCPRETEGERKRGVSLQVYKAASDARATRYQTIRCFWALDVSDQTRNVEMKTNIWVHDCV